MKTVWRFRMAEAGMLLAAGVVCGLKQPRLPLMLLGLCATLGQGVVHGFCQNRMARGERPKLIVLALAVLVSMVLAGVSAWLTDGLGVIPAMAWILLLHGCYGARWFAGPWLFGILAVLSGVLAFHYGVWFPLPWWAVMALLDPAWSFSRWQRLWPGVPVQGAACVLSRH